MSKPTIRIIHHMARTGGTVICKCLASMDEVLLLSEIHPLATEKFNPITQAQDWFQLFSKEEVRNVFPPSLTFNEVLRLINDRVEQQGKKLVLRDWNHLDFTAVPFARKATNRMLLYETLVPDFDILHIATTRHPIDQWLSLANLFIMIGKISLEEFLYGYLRFAEKAKEIGFIRYEDFTRRPDETLRQISGALQVSFDPGYRDKWMHYKKFTGDIENKWQEIKPREKRHVKRTLLKRFEKNKDYWAALDILGYEHYAR